MPEDEFYPDIVEAIMAAFGDIDNDGDGENIVIAHRNVGSDSMHSDQQDCWCEPFVLESPEDIEDFLAWHRSSIQ